MLTDKTAKIQEVVVQDQNHTNGSNLWLKITCSLCFGGERKTNLEIQKSNQH